MATAMERRFRWQLPQHNQLDFRQRQRQRRVGEPRIGMLHEPDAKRLRRQWNAAYRCAKENYDGQQYTSAKLKTRGLFSQKYGRFEFYAKLPQGKGYWPAIWMMPESAVYGRWAASGKLMSWKIGAATRKKSLAHSTLEECLPTTRNRTGRHSIFRLVIRPITSTSMLSNGRPTPFPGTWMIIFTKDKPTGGVRAILPTQKNTILTQLRLTSRSISL